MTHFRYGEVVAGVKKQNIIEQEETKKLNSQVVGKIIQIRWCSCMEYWQELN